MNSWPSLDPARDHAVGHLAHANPDYKHPFLVEREVKRVGFIVISMYLPIFSLYDKIK